MDVPISAPRSLTIPSCLKKKNLQFLLSFLSKRFFCPQPFFLSFSPTYTQRKNHSMLKLDEGPEKPTNPVLFNIFSNERIWLLNKIFSSAVLAIAAIMLCNKLPQNRMSFKKMEWYLFSCSLICR